MPPTTRPSVSPSLDFKEVSRQLESFQQVDSTRQQLVEHLLQRLRELDAALQAANSDLEDQTSIRRHWKKRAEDAEALLAQSQFVLALIDGNRYTFADQYLKNAETGGADAAGDLVEQIRDYIKERSLHEDSTKVCLMVQIFANKTALSQALIDSGTISGPGHFDDFIAQFMRSQPFMYFVDCGSFEGAVDSKIQESYEFHFDNAHCKHLLLALRHDSGYIMELDTYRGDESTLARTSLMRPSHAVIGRFASGFHVALTPALTTIPLISLEHANGATAEKNEESRSSVTRTRFPARNHDLHGLFEVEDQDSPATEQSGVNQSSDIDPTTQKRDSSTTSSTAAVPRNSETANPSPPIKSPPLMQEAKNAPSVPSPGNLTPVQHSNTAPFLGPVHSYMNDWESAPSADIYTPPPDLRPWGSEDGPSWEDASNNTCNDDPIAKRSDRSASREASRKSSDAFEKAPVGKPNHQNSGKGAAGGLMVRKAKQTPRQPLPPRSPNDVPEFIPQSGPGISSSLLESKYSSPSSQPLNPQSASNAAVAINRHGQRIDLLLPRPSAEDQARFDARWHAKKICNDHHLRGECSNGRDCKFDHEPIDEGMRLALKVSARKIPCKIGPGCRRRDCPNGHYCPYRLGPGGCTNKQCFFNARGMHKVDDLKIDAFVPAQ